MVLEVTIPSPIPDDDIVKALSMVTGKNNSSVILSQSEMTYIQTDSVTLEYQEGSLDFHYFCPDPLTFDHIVLALRSYANDNDWWKTAIRWEKGYGG